MSNYTVEPGQEGPVTVSVSRRVVAGQEQAYEAWLHGIIEAASDFPGHMGVNILRPSGRTDGRYVLIYRFDSWETCARWEASDTRAIWVERLDGLVEGHDDTKRVSGLEAWFDLPEVPAQKHAPQWKMSLVLILVVFALVYPLQLLVLPLTETWWHWGRTLLIATIQVCLMTFVVMPRVTRLLKSWLFA